jgi:hypothetical protein
MKRTILILFLISIFSLSTFAQKEKYESLFIYNFTKYIKWPDNYNQGKFVIGVLGNSSIYQSLDEMAESKKKTSSGANLEVIKYNSISDIGECNILFVSENMINKLQEIDGVTSGKPILIVTDSPGMANKGSVINFIEKDGKIKFELNEASANIRNLVVSGSLTSLAILI